MNSDFRKLTGSQSYFATLVIVSAIIFALCFDEFYPIYVGWPNANEGRVTSFLVQFVLFVLGFSCAWKEYSYMQRLTKEISMKARIYEVMARRLSTYHHELLELEEKGYEVFNALKNFSGSSELSLYISYLRREHAESKQFVVDFPGEINVSDHIAKIATIEKTKTWQEAKRLDIQAAISSFEDSVFGEPEPAPQA